MSVLRRVSTKSVLDQWGEWYPTPVIYSPNINCQDTEKKHVWTTEREKLFYLLGLKVAYSKFMVQNGGQFHGCDHVVR
jgi:hypothetical protein